MSADTMPFHCLCFKYFENLQGTTNSPSYDRMPCLYSLNHSQAPTRPLQLNEAGDANNGKKAGRGLQKGLLCPIMFLKAVPPRLPRHMATVVPASFQHYPCSWAFPASGFCILQVVNNWMWEGPRMSLANCLFTLSEVHIPKCLHHPTQLCFQALFTSPRFCTQLQQIHVPKQSTYESTKRYQWIYLHRPVPLKQRGKQPHSQTIPHSLGMRQGHYTP